LALLSQHVANSLKVSIIGEGGEAEARTNTTLNDCKCKIVDFTSPFVPAGASTGQRLPPCYQDHLPADATSFALELENLKDCFLGAGFKGREPEARKCLTRKDATKPAVFLLGDSHARSLKEGLEAATHLEVLPAMWYAAGRTDDLDQVRGILEDQLRAGDVIWWVNRMGGKWHSGDGPIRQQMSPQDLQQFQGDVNVLYSIPIVMSGAVKLVLVEDWAHLGGPDNANRGEASICYMKHTMGQFPTQCSVNYADVKAGRLDALNVLNTMAGKPGVFVFHAPSYLCPQGVCDYNVPNRLAPAYYDQGHLNPYGSLYLSPFICDFMKTNGLH